MCSPCEDAPKEDAGTTEWRERKRAYDRAYRARHKDKINERSRIRIQNDPAYREKRRAAKREHYQRHKEEIREYFREKWRTDADYRAKSRARCRITMRKKRFKGYGITLDQFEQMFALQGSACAVCRKTGVTLCVDHCHRTGEIRGLLCRRCNIALGYCDDDPDILLAAVAYLRSWRDQQREAHGTDPPVEPLLQGKTEGRSDSHVTVR
jgi:hypothetical protein